MQLFPRAVHGQHILRQFPAEHRIDRGEPFAVATGLELRLAVADEAERNFWVCQRLLLHHRRDG